MQCFCNGNMQKEQKVGAPYCEGERVTCNTNEEKQ